MRGRVALVLTALAVVMVVGALVAVRGTTPSVMMCDLAQRIPPDPAGQNCSYAP